MLDLQAPMALAALLGLLVPLLIHFWERRQARRIQVGSIRWLQASEDARVSRFRFTDLWRFLLRASIVALFVFLLAAPHWRPEQAPPRAPVWVLVDPSVDVRGTLSQILDSLGEAGIPVKALQKDLPDWPVPPETSSRPVPVWSYLRELAVRPSFPDTVRVFSPSRFQAMRGPRPALPFRVEWNVTPSPPELYVLVKAWQRDDRLQLLLAESGAERLAFQQFEVPAETAEVELPDPFPRLKVSRALDNTTGNPIWELDLESTGRNTIIAEEPKGRHVSLFAEKEYQEDVPYIRAALRAAAGYLELPLVVEMPEGPEELPGPDIVTRAGTRLLFWLSADPLPEAADSLYAGRIVQPDSILFLEGAYVEFEQQGWAWKRAPGALSRDPLGNEGLTEAMVGLLYADRLDDSDSLDRRTIARAQALPAFRTASGGGFGDSREAPSRSLFFPFWLLLAALFLIERLL